MAMPVRLSLVACSALMFSLIWVVACALSESESMVQ